MVGSMEHLPPDLIEAIQGLAAEGLPVEQIAFMTHTSPGLVRKVMAKTNDEEVVNTTSTLE